MQPLSTVEIARRQRHLYLLQRVRAGKSLSAGQLRELQEYEELMVKTKKQTVVKKTKAARRKKKPGVKQASLTEAMVKTAAMQAEDMPAAAVMLEVDDLAKRLSENKKIEAAWEKGRQLKNIAELASAGVTVHEAEETLEMKEGQLAELLATDKEARDTWNQSRIKTIVEIKKVLIGHVKDGKPVAARQMERILMRELARPEMDFTRMTVEQLAAIVGRSRQTIHTWYTEHNLPRNSDGTYDLKVFLDWFEQFTIKKVNQLPGRFTDQQLDPLKARKAEKLQIEIAQSRGELVERSEVLAGILARYQNLINICQRKGTELAMLIHGQPVEKAAQILSGFFTELRKSLCWVPEELNLTDQAKKKFYEFLESLDAA